MRELADLHAGGLTRIRIEVEVDPAVNAAARFLYAVAGDIAGVLRLLERSIDGGFFCYAYVQRDPRLEPLRHDPGYQRAALEPARFRHEAFRRRFF